MRSVKIIVVLAALFAVGGLPVYSQQEIPKDLVITLERTMCFGWCPAYALTITADGTVKFTPTGNFVYRGAGADPNFPLSDRITADQLKVLITEFEKINFYS